MPFHPFLIVPLIFGVVLVLFAGVITKFIFRRSSGSWFDTSLRRGIFFTWTMRAAGLLTLIFVFVTATGSADQVSLNWDKNKLKLLKNGVVKQGGIIRVRYHIRAPAGWAVYYEFDAKEPQTGKAKIYSGSSEGPKKYYYGLSAGHDIGVIYDPSNPKLNCEIRCFLNKPSYRNAFKKADKLELLERIKGKYELENYTFKEWYKQQWEK